jgi:hypothetical protein
MATARESNPKVEYRHDDGRDEHQIGVVISGAFVPFARVHDSQAKQLVENAGNRKASDDDDGNGSE